MRILQINKYHFIKGGADRVYFNTIKLLEEHGHKVASFSTLRPENNQSKYSEYFVPYIEHRHNNALSNLINASRYLYNKTAFENLKRLLDTFKPDIAHLHLFYGDLSASILKALRQSGVPVVMSVHDYRLLCPANTFLDSHNRICEKCRNRSYYNCAIKKCLEGNFFYSSVLAVEGYYRKYFIDPLDYIDRFIFVSKFTEAKHIEFDQRYAGKSEQLYNFTHVEREDNKIEKGSYFLFFGRLVKEKGIETLLKAVRMLDVSLKIAGTGPLEKEVIDCTAINKNVTFLGHQTGPDLKELVKNASFVIVPSECYENNPMTIVEAYAAGVPVIATRIGGIPEIVMHEKTGFLFESRNITSLADAMNMAKKISPDEYASLSQNCREFAMREFSSEAHYNHLMHIYSKITKND